MNDRFKFRYVYENKVYDVAKLDLLWEEVQVDKYDHVDTYSLALAPGSLLQCTGLKDKNGTLIYEGDIVKVFSLEQSGYIEWNDKYLQWFIDLSRVYGKAEYSYYLTELYDFDSKNDLEVIGNIYENPELLKGVKDE